MLLYGCNAVEHFSLLVSTHEAVGSHGAAHSHGRDSDAREYPGTAEK